MRAVLPLYLVHAIFAYAQDGHVGVASSSSAPTPALLRQPTCPAGLDLRQAWCCPLLAGSCPLNDTSSADTDGSAVPAHEEADIPASAIARPAVNDTAPATGPDDFVSFEEWKRIRAIDHEPDPPSSRAEQPSVSSAPLSSSAISADPAPVNATAAPPSKDHPPEASAKDAMGKAEPPAGGALAKPRDRPPVGRGRFNYASPDCSARIHASSPQTQHAGSILQKSRDRYMLTPCKAAEHWVVVELCDEIRVEALEVAVWEFFSGVVKEVRVSVGGEDEEDGEGAWEEVATFTAKNVRGSQTFALAEPTSFHRFLRLDFASFYGNEYYCPVSQVLVYGMNQMEAFKWEQRRLAPRAKDRERERAELEKAERERAEHERAAAAARDRAELEQRAAQRADEAREEARRERELVQLEKLVQEQVRKLGAESMDVPDERAAGPRSTPAAAASGTTGEAAPASDSARQSPPPARLQNWSSPSIDSVGVSSETVAASSSASRASLATDQPTNASAVTVPASSAAVSTSGSTSSSSTPPLSSSSASTARVPTRSDASESIYAQIIRRLTALEGNNTLVARYVEEQGRALRLLLAKAESRLDGLRAELALEQRADWAREQMRAEERLGRLASQLESMRLANEHERRAADAQLRALADELGYERRRSLVQLLVLGVAIVVGALTRIDAIEAVLRPILAEARRRRSVRRSRSSPFPFRAASTAASHGDPSRPLQVGPLAGLRINVGPRDSPSSPSPSSGSLLTRRPSSERVNGQGHFYDGGTQSTPMHKGRGNHPGHALSLSRPHTPARRPGTPSLGSTRRKPSGGPAPLSPRPTSPGAVHAVAPLQAATASHAYRPRTSLPPLRGGRRLARSAHLHPLDSDRRRNSDAGPRPDALAALDHVHAAGATVKDDLDASKSGRFATPPAVERDEWDTEDGFSASEVEDETFRVDQAEPDERSADGEIDIVEDVTRDRKGTRELAQQDGAVVTVEKDCAVR